MDYLPINIVSGRPADAKVDYFTPVIGEYDYLAIKYGYMEVEGEKPGLPHPTLKAMAEHDLPFATDDELATQDPYVQKRDMTSDPIRFYDDRLNLVTEVRQTLLNRAVDHGDSLAEYSQAQLALFDEVLKAGTILATFIGGFNVTHSHRPSSSSSSSSEFPGPVAVVSASDQQRALDAVLRVLADDDPDENGGNQGPMGIFPQALDFSYMLFVNATKCKENGDCYNQRYLNVLSVRDYVQSTVLTSLLDTKGFIALRHGAWYQQAAGEEIFGVTTLLNSLTHNLWGPELAQSPRVLQPRNWNVQWAYLKHLMALSTNSVLSLDVKAPIFAELLAIKQSVKAALAADGAAAQTSYPFLLYVSGTL